MKTGLLLCGIMLLGMSFFTACRAVAMEIQLEKQGDVYFLPVRINGVITLNFTLDSGASEVCIPSNIAPTLLQAGAITDKDFLPGKSFRLANGSHVRSSRFVIKELNIGGYRIFNVPACIVPKAGFPLLGKTILNKVDSWSLDNRTHKLTLTGVEPASTIEATPASNAPSGSAEATNSTGNAHQFPSSSVNTAQPKPESAKKPIPPSVSLDAQGVTHAHGSKPLIAPSVDHENMR